MYIRAWPHHESAIPSRAYVIRVFIRIHSGVFAIGAASSPSLLCVQHTTTRQHTTRQQHDDVDDIMLDERTQPHTRHTTTA